MTDQVKAEHRRVEHDDGRIEIVRILDDHTLKDWKEWNPIAYEASVVWIKNVANIPFVRSMWVTKCNSRRNRLVPDGSGEILGFSKLTTDAPTNPEGYYTRRIFFRLDGDADLSEFPPGALVPKTILPGILGNRDGTIESNRQNDPPPVKTRQSRVTNERAKAAIAELKMTTKQEDILVAALVPASGEPLLIDRREAILGRGAACDIRLPMGSISTEHCRLFFEGGSWWIIDLASTSGVKVNGESLTPEKRHPLRNGDKVGLAQHVFAFEH